jgi:hypothetical protein
LKGKSGTSDMVSTLDGTDGTIGGKSGGTDQTYLRMINIQVLFPLLQQAA